MQKQTDKPVQPDLIALMERQQAISDYRDRRRQRLADRGYRPPVSKFPRALLRQYGITPGKDWTPRDAWSALQAAGHDPLKEYRILMDMRRAK